MTQPTDCKLHLLKQLMSAFNAIAIWIFEQLRTARATGKDLMIKLKQVHIMLKSHVYYSRFAGAFHPGVHRKITQHIQNKL